MNPPSTLVSLFALCLCLGLTPAASAAVIYSQDFQTFASTHGGFPGTVFSQNDPDGWTGSVRAFGGGGVGTVSVEGGNHDIALISQAGASSFTAIRDLGVPVAANTIYTLDVDGGVYARDSGKSATLQWELGTINGGGFTAFTGTPNTATVTNLGSLEKYFGTGGEIPLAQYSYTTGGAVTGDNVAIRLGSVNNGSNDTGGFDSIVVNAVPEPGSLSLIAVGLAGLATRRRR